MNEAKANIFEYRGSDLNNNYYEPDTFTARDVLMQGPVSFKAMDLVNALCKQELEATPASLGEFSRKELIATISRKTDIREGQVLTIGEYLEAIYKLVFPDSTIINVHLNTGSGDLWPIGFDLRNLNNIFQHLRIKNPSHYNFFSLLAYYRQLQRQRIPMPLEDEAETELEIGEDIEIYLKGGTTNVKVFAQFIGKGNAYMTEKIRLNLVTKLRDKLVSSPTHRPVIGRREAIIILTELLITIHKFHGFNKVSGRELDRISRILNLLNENFSTEETPTNHFEIDLDQMSVQERLLKNKKVSRKEFTRYIAKDNKKIKVTIDNIIREYVPLAFDEHLGSTYIEIVDAIKILRRLIKREVLSDPNNIEEADRIREILRELQGNSEEEIEEKPKPKVPLTPKSDPNSILMSGGEIPRKEFARLLEGSNSNYIHSTLNNMAFRNQVTFRRLPNGTTQVVNLPEAIEIIETIISRATLHNSLSQSELNRLATYLVSLKQVAIEA